MPLQEIMVHQGTKIFKPNTLALNSLTLCIKHGEFVVVLGESGCGKTTLLRCIVGLEKLTAGEILINGKTIESIPIKIRGMAMVFQDHALYPNMTVYENLAFALKGNLPKETIRARIKNTLQLLEIEELSKRKPATLSGGQCQRVALGRALVREPKILLLDEPLSSLDAQLRKKMRFELIKLHKQLGLTCIYVTHDQEEAMTMGTKILVLKSGTLQQYDTPYNVYKSPSNVFVASFIGMPQINWACAKVSDSDNGIIFQGGSKLKLDASIVSVLKNHQALLVGIRSEAIVFIQSPSNSGSEFYGRIINIALLGRELSVSFDWNGIIIQCVTTADRIFVNDKWITFVFDLKVLLYFNPNTQERIL